MTDTSAEAIDRLTKRLGRKASLKAHGVWCSTKALAAATLRALAAERDAYQREMQATSQQADMLLAERDRLAAQVAKLREALAKIASRDPNAVGGGKRAVEYDAMRYEACAALAGDTP